MARKTSGMAASRYEERLALYEQLISSIPEVALKGATMPYTSVGGNMFSLFTRDATLALRLPQDEREAFLRTYKTRLTVQYGKVMGEYVDVPDALLANKRVLQRFFAMSYEYAKSLKPKATTRPKQAAAKKRR